MVKTLTKHGNSYALVVDRSILDLLKINPSTPLDITTDGKSLIISPIADPKRRKKLEDAIAKSQTKFGRMYQRLAHIENE